MFREQFFSLPKDLYNILFLIIFILKVYAIMNNFKHRQYKIWKKNLKSNCLLLFFAFLFDKSKSLDFIKFFLVEHVLKNYFREKRYLKKKRRVYIPVFNSHYYNKTYSMDVSLIAISSNPEKHTRRFQVLDNLPRPSNFLKY